MAQQNFNFQRLAEQLGLKNVADLPVVEAITPTVVIGDGTQITAPLLPPSAFAGGVQAIVAGRSPYLQLRAAVSGGIFVEAFFTGGTIQTDFRVDRDGVDPLAVSPIPPSDIVDNFETGFGTTQSECRVGTSTVQINANNVPVFFNAISEAKFQRDWFLPSGGLFTLKGGPFAAVGYFMIRWREVPSPALNPTPD